MKDFKTLLGKIWRALRLPKNIQLFVMRRMQSQFLIGVTGVFLDDKDKILLFKHTYRQIQWSLPGGYLSATEHPDEGLEREVYEESKMTVSADRQLHLLTDREAARLEVSYLGKYISGKFKPSSEVIEGKFFAKDKLPAISRKQIVLIEEVFEMLEREKEEKNKTIQAKRKATIAGKKFGNKKTSFQSKVFSLFGSKK